jgi:predicted Zn-dependent protease
MDEKTSSAPQNAENLLKEEQLQQAQVRLVRLLQSNPALEQGWYLLSFTFQDPDQKYYALQQALRIKPDFQAAQEQLRILQEPATTQAEEAQFASTDETFLEEIKSLLEVGYQDEARALLQVYLAQNPHDSQAWYLISLTEPTHRGKINLLRHALRVDPTLAVAQIQLAQLQAAPSRVLTTVTNLNPHLHRFLSGFGCFSPTSS